MCEPSEVIGPGMNLLHERGFGVDDPSAAEHTMDLLDRAERIRHMFQNRLNYDAVETSVLKREIVRIANKLDKAPKRYIRSYQFEIIALGQLLQTVTQLAAADDQDLGTAGVTAQQFSECPVVSLRHPIPRKTRDQAGEELLGGTKRPECSAAPSDEIADRKCTALVVDQNRHATNPRISGSAGGILADQLLAGAINEAAASRASQ
jgi:hypothetical protein